MPGPDRPRDTPVGRYRLAILTLTAIAARAATFGNPIVHTDEEFYLVFARAMVGGAMPYVDIWDRKPIGLFALYLLPALFRPAFAVLAYQTMALASVVATAALIARLADRAGWRRGALPAGLLYIVWLDLADGQGGQAPVFYNLLMVAAVTLATGPGLPKRRGLAAMALIGLALQIKYSVVFEGVTIGLWLLWRERASPGIAVAYGAALVWVALLPTMLVATWFWWQGAGEAFLYANFLSILARHADAPAEQIANLSAAAGILAPFLALAAASILAARAPRGDPVRTIQSLLIAWLIAALFGFGLLGSWFNHYTLPVMAPAAACAAGVFGHRRFGRAVAAVVLAAGFVAGQVVLQSERRGRGTPAQFAALVRAIRPAPGTLYVYSGSAMLYAATGRAPLSRYVLPSHLYLARERGAIGVDQMAEIARIFAQVPDVVVTEAPLYEESPDTAALVRRELARGRYRLDATMPLGRYALAVYRRPTTRTSPPAGH